MVELIIVSKNNNKYELRQKNGLKRYKLMFEFFGIEKPELYSSILIDEKLLDRNFEGFSQPYSFERYLEYSDSKIIPIESEDFIVLHNKSKNYIVERIYG